MAETWIQNLITVETNPVTRLWTGVGSLTIGGQSFTGGGAALSVSAMELTSGEPDRRIKIEISGIPNSLRSKFLQDVGPVPVLIEWVWSSDSGATWNKLRDIQFRGRLSSPSFANGVFSVELETYRGDVDRGAPRLWSHEDQQRRTAGDKGMEYMRLLSQEGVETGWPP